jgi:hypothetical protein
MVVKLACVRVLTGLIPCMGDNRSLDAESSALLLLFVEEGVAKSASSFVSDDKEEEDGVRKFREDRGRLMLVIGV